MPMKSKAQRAYLHANEPTLAAEFERATPKGKKLPDRLHPALTSAQSIFAKLHGKIKKR